MRLAHNNRAAGKSRGQSIEGERRMARLIKLVIVLAALGFAGLAGFAYLGDLAPVPQEIRQPVKLDAG